MKGRSPKSHAATDLPELKLPERYNYIAAFLTLGCNLKCPYCINWLSAKSAAERHMPAADWIAGLNRLRSRGDLPVTLQGGEPTLHAGFYEIVSGLRSDLNIDVLTNIQFDVDEFMARVPPERLRRDAPYASIRVSYHPPMMALAGTKAKVLRLLEKGYSVGIWAVRHPSNIEQIEHAGDECAKAGIDFRFKEFLGYHDGKLHGQYKYPDAVGPEQADPDGRRNPGPRRRKVRCRTSELIIGPAGGVYRCHSDLYNGREPIGHLLDPAFVIEDVFRPCGAYGTCNPCDIKVKTNRFQQFGHTSVEIEF